MLTRKALRYLLASALALMIVSSLSMGQGRGDQPGAKERKPSVVIQLRARGGGSLSQGLRDKIRGVPNVGRVESFLEGRTADGVRLIGVEPASVLYLPSGKEILAAAIVQGRGLGAGDAPEAMVVGKTFAQNNKTALGLSISAMLTKDHFPPIIVGGQGFAIVGIYTTGDPRIDDQVLVLLPTAQKMLNQAGRLSGVYAIPASPAATDEVIKDLRRLAGDAVEVTPLVLKQR
jgi:ABC-type lipoprotein release transport system permease subunit